MKCLACRPPLPGYASDIEDIRFLIRKMNIRTLEQLNEHVERFYPNDVLHDQARVVIDGILGEPREEES